MVRVQWRIGHQSYYMQSVGSIIMMEMVMKVIHIAHQLAIAMVNL